MAIHGKTWQYMLIHGNTQWYDKIDKKIIYLMSDTQGVVSQSPEPRAHDKSVWQYKRKIN